MPFEPTTMPPSPSPPLSHKKKNNPARKSRRRPIDELANAQVDNGKRMWWCEATCSLVLEGQACKVAAYNAQVRFTQRWRGYIIYNNIHVTGGAKRTAFASRVLEIRINYTAGMISSLSLCNPRCMVAEAKQCSAHAFKPPEIHAHVIEGPGL